MAVVPPPDIPQRSPLWGLSFKVEVIQSKLYSLFEDLNGVWLIGEYLSYPFYLLAYYTGETVGFLRDADIWLVKHRSWLESIFDGSKFRELLYDLSYNFQWIRNDPLGWVSQQIRTLSGELSHIITDANGWIRNKIQQIFPAVSDIQFNRNNWIRNAMQGAFGAVFYFLINPRDVLRQWIMDISPFLRGIINGGYSYILSQFTERASWFRSFLNNPQRLVKNWLGNIQPEFNDFIYSPRQWIIRKIGELFNLSNYEVNNLPTLFGLIALRSIRNYLEPHKDEIRNISCDIIKKFL